MSHHRFAYALATAGTLWLLGCGEGTRGADVEASAQALVTNCTAPALSAAIAQGGDVAIDCGPGPVSIAIPRTNVAHDTVLRSLRPGTISITNTGTLFEVASGVSFEIRDFSFFGTALAGAVVHTVGGRITLSGDSFGNYPGFVISVHNGSNLTVDRCTFANNGIGQSSAAFAGSIYNEGSMTSVQNSTFTNNHSNGSGGAITNFGSLSVASSTFANNGASAGGAIYSNTIASLQVTNSTFVGNAASSTAGAIYFGGFQTQATVNSSTFVNNASPNGTFVGNLALFDTILVDPLVPTTPCKLGGTGNLQWPAGPPLCGAGFVRGDPHLGPLASNGGPTQTMAIQLPSAAFRAATLPCPATDQRGLARAQDRDPNDSGICDIGAYEF